MNRKSQTSSEFIMLLAFVMLVASITLAVVNPSSVFNFSEKNSLDYWKSSSLAVDVILFDNQTYFGITNNLRTLVNITNIVLDETDAGVSFALIEPGTTEYLQSSNVYSKGFSLINLTYSVGTSVQFFTGNNIPISATKSSSAWSGIFCAADEFKYLGSICFSDSDVLTYWKFDSNLQDSSGNYLDGTKVGAATVSNKVLNLDGEDSKVYFSTRFLEPGSFSISTWVYRVNTSKVNSLILTQGRDPWAAINTDFSLYFSSNTSVPINFILIEDAGSKTSVSSATSLDFYTWYHVAATYNSTNSQMRLYLDGLNEINGTQAWTLNKTTVLFSAIGNQGNGVSYDFNGSIDETLIFNRTLTSAEVSSIYSAKRSYP